MESLKRPFLYFETTEYLVGFYFWR